ncbi:PDZ domain-containing protein [Corynebacterium sp. 320]|uniref:YlbL family protein n=1 Tax=Corynebacterium TaxID=1716 RepID=UPI00125CC5D8|nr:MULTISPECIES: PDZ domain-containing protein [Corynebacterium]KAB1504143.1 PDZ domain-containing protein [Corynebacterium sp. 320]KAB1552757.1 PDZ domain-containing protein [Corynebacterium sp. 321]KAB1554025.1 PDZ domain-containing protein [Corynebacterium sp. 319]KAB3528279.1 PDZ domain-containing protein [Corynebacterium sp. 250]KAB3540232.1 PDZ domain-containing protein [Corynebacterium sp. 366]
MNLWNRRNRTVIVGALPVVVLLSLLGLPKVPGTDIDLTVPYAAEGKGPTFNTLGEVDGKEVVEIKGAEVDKTSGNLNMTTVAVRTHMTLAQALTRWATTDDTMVPLENIFPTGVSQEEVEERNAVAFTSSASNATISAMNYLNKPIESVVVDVTPDSPADKALKVNDIVTAVDDEKVATPSDLAEIIQHKNPGDTVTLTVTRQAKDERIPVTLGERKVDGDAVTFLGVTTLAQPAGDITVNYNLSDVGGPSAGLMFSLAVVDKLSPGELTGGKFVAGTGTISADGSVGPIGGITHKIAAAKEAGAEVFLVPEGNCTEAMTAKNKPTLLKVDSLDTAVKQLKDYAAGKDVQTCG